MSPLLNLAYNMKYCARFFYLLLLLSTVASTQADANDRRECQALDSACDTASRVLLQRASHLQTAIDSTGLPKAFQRLDHDGLEWPGAPAMLSLASKSSDGGKTRSFDDGKITVFDGVHDPAVRNLTFITVQDKFFNSNLGRSSLWQNKGTLPHQWILIDNFKNEGISSLYAESQKKAENELLVFLHADVFLPEGWYDNFMHKLAHIEDVDPNWAVLGTAGVPLHWTPKAGVAKIASSITDCFQSFSTGTDAMNMQSFDEHLLILRKQWIYIAFDPQLPGFDLYGTDIVLSARQRGKNAYLLNIPLLHKTVGEDGQKYNAELWKVKFNDNSFQSRAHGTIEFLSKKWCASGLLPVFGSAFDVWPCN